VDFLGYYAVSVGNFLSIWDQPISPIFKRQELLTPEDEIEKVTYYGQLVLGILHAFHIGH
jgi:hypothetical protein